jgi:hypothetical protein
VPSEQVAEVRGKGSYPLRSTMIHFEYLTDAPFECGPGDVNVAAFMEATSIIVGRDVVEEFLHVIYGHLARSVSLRWR